MMGQYEETISICKKILQKQPDQLYPHIHLAASYMAIGREGEARAEGAEVLRINPKFSLDFWAKTSASKEQSVNENLINAGRKAGLK